MLKFMYINYIFLEGTNHVNNRLIFAATEKASKKLIITAKMRIYMLLYNNEKHVEM